MISDDEARTKVVDFLFQNLPLSGAEGSGTGVGRQRRDAGVPEAVGVIGIVGLLWSASALMGALRNALAVVWGTERDRPPLRGKALDVMLFLGSGS